MTGADAPPSQDLLDGRAIAATAAALIATEPTGGQEDAALDHVAGWLQAAGVVVERTTVPTRDLLAHPHLSPFHSQEVDRQDVPVLVASVAGRGGPGRRLLLNAHVDVIPARHQAGWEGDPFTATVDGAGWLVGRGAADTLGGLAAAMHVMAALARDGGEPLGGGSVVLTPVVGEEDGGCGTLATIAAGVRADGAVVIEPTGLRLAPATAGALCFRITVPGRTAHGSVRHTGVSAIEKGWLVHRAVQDLEADRNRRLAHPLLPGPHPVPICMGRIEGGDQRCDEAAWLTIEGRLGSAPHEPVVTARGELEATVARCATADPWLAEHPPTVEWIGAQWVGGDTPVDDPLVRAVQAVDPDVEVVGMTYGCDLGLLRQAAGIPGVVFGPGEAAAAHAPGERVRVDDLERCARTLLGLALRFCPAR